MAKYLIFFVFLTLLAISYGRLDGLRLRPEILKTITEIRIGNDYMDYNPSRAYTFREVADVPVIVFNSIGERIDKIND